MEVIVNPVIGSSVVSQPAPVAGTGSPVPLSSQGATLRTKILQRIEERTSPAAPPKVWSFLGTSNSVRRLSGDASELVASLTADFGEAELLAARILEQGPTGGLRLSHVFGDTSSSFVIRRNTAQSPIDVASARGLLSSEKPEWLDLAAERTDTLEDQPHAVLAAFDDNEALVFHRLGLKFTAAAELEKISGKRVRELFTARAPRREQHKYDIILPAWQITTGVNKPSPTTLAAITHIAEIRKYCGDDPADVFAVWLPTAAEFRNIRRAMAFGERRVVAAAVSKSLKHSRYSPADALRLINDRTEITYGAARRQLQRAVESSRRNPRAGDVDVALAKFWQAFQKSVVNKFLTFAAGDGWDEWRSMMAAELAEKWFDKLEIVAAARRVLAGEYPAYRETFDADLFDLQLRMAREFERLYRLKPPGCSLVGRA